MIEKRAAAWQGVGLQFWFDGQTELAEFCFEQADLAAEEAWQQVSRRIQDSTHVDAVLECPACGQDWNRFDLNNGNECPVCLMIIY